MGGRLFRSLALMAALFPIVATIAAPDVDGLARAVSTLFRTNQPESAEPHVAFPTPGSALPIAGVSPIEAPVGMLPEASAMAGREGPLGEQSLKGDTPSVVSTAARPEQKRGTLLTSLYVSFIGLQALDAHSTMRALDRGAVESNPLIEPFAGNPAALIALKAGTTVGVLYMTERVRRHNRVASIVIMAAANSVYATIVAKNYRIGSIAR